MDNDTISRQAAIDALRYAQHRFTVSDEAGGMGTVKWSENVIYSAAAERVLTELPSVQPETNCSEIPNSSGLQKCPFCGKEARVRMNNYRVINPSNGGKPYFVVMYTLGCFDCGVTFAYESYFEPNNTGTAMITQDGYSVAAAKWNRRGV
jgi:hypothetical protein